MAAKEKIISMPCSYLNLSISNFFIIDMASDEPYKWFSPLVLMDGCHLRVNRYNLRYLLEIFSWITWVWWILERRDARGCCHS